MRVARKPLIDWERKLRSYEDESARFFKAIDAGIDRCDAVLADIKKTREKIDESVLGRV